MKPFKTVRFGNLGLSNLCTKVRQNAALYSLLALLGAQLLSSPSFAYQIYRTGADRDIQKPTAPMTCLAGGGSDDGWAQGFRHMLNNSNGGDIVVIRADDKRGQYEDWIYNDPNQHQFPKVHSVSTLVLESREDSQRIPVVELIKNAEMIFFAGGYQDKYIHIIQNTPLEAALNYVLHKKKIPFGGTSAGMAILGDIDYQSRFNSPSGENKFVTAEDVLNDPTASFVDLGRGFLTAPFLNGVITDTHFSERQRQSRLMGFMARAVFNNYHGIKVKNIKGIGVDESTAVCFGKSGIAKVFGRNHAFFLQGNNSIERIEKGASLDWYGQRKAVRVYAIHGTLNQNAQFNLSTWKGQGGEERFWHVDGHSSQSPVFGEN